MLAELGRDADLFIIESTDRPGETQRPDRNLMTSAEAGRFGQQAGARRLMLTHFWPGTDRAASVAAASAPAGAMSKPGLLIRRLGERGHRGGGWHRKYGKDGSWDSK
jgi:hypothetical protein